MTTIAKLVTEIGGDPTGLTQALRESTGAIDSFVSSTTQNFQALAKGTDLNAFASKSLNSLKNTLKNEVGQIRSDLFRRLIDPRDATAAGVEAAVQFNEGLAKTIGQIQATGGAGVGAIRAQLSKEFLDVGKLSAVQLANGIRQGASVVEAETNTIATKAGRSFAQTWIATIHRHRALIPTLAGLIIGQTVGGFGDAAKAIEGLSGIQREEQKVIELGKAGEKILHELSVLASFVLDPIPGLIVAVAGGVISAVIGMFTAAKERLQKLREEFQKELDNLVNSVDQLGLQKKLEEVLLGTRSSGLSQLVANAFKGGLLDLQARTTRDLAELAKLNEKNRLAGGLLTLDKNFRAQVDVLQKLIDERAPRILELQRQQALLQDALLNPAPVRAGFGGQLPASVTKTATTDVKDLKKELTDLLSLFRALQAQPTPIGPEGLAVIDKILEIYSKLNDELNKLGADKKPFDPQVIAVKELRLEVDQLLESLNKLADTGVQFAAPKVPPLIIPDLGGRRRPDVSGGPSINELRLRVKIDQVMQALDDFGGALSDFVKNSARSIVESIAGQLNPFSTIIGAINTAAGPLVPFITKLANIVGNVLGPVFDAFAPVLESLLPIFDAILRVLAPILKAFAPLLGALVPILEALFPIFKFGAIIATFLFQAFAEGAAIFTRAIGNIVIGFGTIIKALAIAVDKLPFVSAKGAINAAQGIIDFGRGLLAASDQFKKAADDMGKAREEIKSINLDPTQTAIDSLGDAANTATQALLNVPQGFKVATAAFNASDPTVVESRLRPNPGATFSIGTINVSVGNGATASDAADEIVTELKRRARAQLGDARLWSQVQV